MLKRLRIKFICINMLIVTAMLCVILGMVYYFTRQNLESESLRMMRELAEDASRPGPPGPRRTEARIPCFILEIAPSGDIIATGSGYYDLSDTEFLQEITEAVLEAGGHTGVIAEYKLRYQRVFTRVSQRIVFADMSGELSTLSSLIKTCAAIGILSLLAFFLVSLILAHWAVKPIERAWIQQRQFVADASHELKTPLTVILTSAELLQEPGRDEKARAQFSSSILSMAKQMRGLVEGLLDLVRLDSGTVKDPVLQFDFSELISNAILPFEPLYFEQGLEIRSAIEPGIMVGGSERRLRQVAEILLDNAMKYSSSPAAVRVELRRHGLHCVLSVSNPGGPLSPEELKNIFKRFYRIDKVRSMNHSYGLGLSIAESIVREHRGRIWAESRDGINTFFVELPVSSC